MNTKYKFMKSRCKFNDITNLLVSDFIFIYIYLSYSYYKIFYLFKAPTKNFVHLRLRNIRSSKSSLREMKQKQK